MHSVSVSTTKRRDFLKRIMDTHTIESSGSAILDRPAKMPRLKVRPDDHRPEYVFGLLEQQIHDFGHVVPAKGDRSVIIDFAQNCTALLRKINSCFERVDVYQYSLMLEQLHGLLFLWLDFKISLSSTFDVTSEDCFDSKSKLIAITNHICACLEEVYRCSKVTLYTNETLQLLIKAYLLFVSHPCERSSTLNDCDEMKTLLRTINATIQNVNSDIFFSFYTYQQFLLRLVGTISLSRNKSESHVCSLSCDILQRLCGINHRCEMDELTVSTFTNVAWSTVSGPNQSAAMNSSSAVEIFYIQCLLQLPSFDLREINADIVSSLKMKILTRYMESFNAHIQIQALDCMVAISSRWCLSAIPDTLFVVLLDAMLHILTDLDSISDFDVFLKGKAIEGLQNLLVLDDSLPRCKMWFEDKKERSITRFLSSLRDVTHVVEDQRMYGYQCSYSSIVDTAIFRMEDIAISAAEILLSVLCMSLQEFESDSMCVPVCYVVSTCVEVLRCNHFTNQHIVYLTVHMICREHRENFFSIVQTYPELLSSLAELIVKDDDAYPFTTYVRLILPFLQDLLQTCPSFRTVVVRQRGVLEAIANIAHKLQNNGNDTTNEEIRIMAIQLLYTLSYDVFNRRLMARQAYVLSSMIRFVRGIQTDTSISITGGIPARGFHRDAVKQRISQLVAVL